MVADVLPRAASCRTVLFFSLQWDVESTWSQIDHVYIACRLRTNQELVLGQVEMAHQLGHLKEKNAEHQIRPFVVDLEQKLGVIAMCG